MLSKEELLERLEKEKFYPFDGKGIILLGYRGSVSHGTYIPKQTDDVDVISVFIPPPEYVYGLCRSKTVAKKGSNEEIDFVAHPFRKFVSMMSGSNPNVLNLLWLEDRFYLKKTKWGDRLIENRDIFLSKKYCYNAFRGYARRQLILMKKAKFQGYMGQKRKEIVRKYGYDIKQGAHLCRLLNMGIEILTTGKVNVFRENDADMYISIKKGEWSLERVKNTAEKLFKELDNVKEKSILPEEPDWDKINGLCVEILQDYYKC